jgi:hypothetical protein
MTGGGMSDLLTILRTEGGLATKQIRPEPKTGKLIVTGYGRAKHFSVREQPVDDLISLSVVLADLARASLCFAIRGAALPGINRARCRRLRYPDPHTGDAARFTDAPRHWFAVDLDKLACPVTVDPLAEPADAVEYLIGLLPPELYDASCWWQWTSSQSLPGHAETLSARLWFWSVDPISDAELTRWSRSANQRAGFRLIDPCLYRAIQPHYTAAPIFAGMRDPLPRRHGVRRGLDDAVTLVIPEPGRANHYADGGAVGRGVPAYLDEIGGERGFRAPILSAVASYFAINGPEADPQAIKKLIRDAIDAAPRGGRSDAELERYRSDRHLDEMLQWCARQEEAKPQRRPWLRTVTIPDGWGAP